VAGPWNHNIHYRAVVLDAVPDGCERALDVGCGEGWLARDLRRSVPHVTGIDRDGPSIELARRHEPASDIEYVLGDFLEFPFEPGSFDLVASVAALHHMDTAAALQRMLELLRPGGTLAVVGLGRDRFPADAPRVLAAKVVSRTHRAARGYWESPALAISPPAETYGELRRLAERALPQARFRRHLLWRYSLVWTKPAP
jgi:SAM-dependent methyltransferase